jgi:hypothetical protein
MGRTDISSKINTFVTWSASALMFRTCLLTFDVACLLGRFIKTDDSAMVKRCIEKDSSSYAEI